MAKKKKRGYLFLILIFLLGCAGWAEAGTITLGIAPYTAPADFAKFRLYRMQGPCAAGPLQPLVLEFPKPASGPMPTTFVDTTVPNIDGSLCYEMTAVDTPGNESAHSNRATATVNLDPPPVPQNLQVQSVSP